MIIAYEPRVAVFASKVNLTISARRSGQALHCDCRASLQNMYSIYTKRRNARMRNVHASGHSLVTE
jgi:hypothetical protein